VCVRTCEIREELRGELGRLQICVCHRTLTLQVNYFKNRRVSEYEKEQLLKRHEEEYLKKS